MCISVPESTALAAWIREVDEVRNALDACSLVTREPDNARRKKVTVDPLKLDVATVVSEMMKPGMLVHISWEDCGETNAYYAPLTQTIEMCNELRKEPRGFVIKATAHEMTHALIHQLNLPITGTDEFAADEYAMIHLVRTGRTKELLEAAKWYAEHPSPEDPSDTHPSNARRAFNYECFADAVIDPEDNRECAIRYQTAALRWDRLLEVAGAK